MPLSRDNYDEYWGNYCPKCPHCDKNIDISKHELYKLYEDGEHAVCCPYCDKEFQVSVRVRHSYDTSTQPSPPGTAPAQASGTAEAGHSSTVEPRQ